MFYLSGTSANADSVRNLSRQFAVGNRVINSNSAIYGPELRSEIKPSDIKKYFQAVRKTVWQISVCHRPSGRLGCRLSGISLTELVPSAARAAPGATAAVTAGTVAAATTKAVSAAAAAKT